ncbi:MAG: F0F1 ATP synthase subunit B [Patescibacteria group bacterium]
MELLESLGINGKLILAQIINFIVLVYLLRRFLYGPIVKMLEDRREKIAAGLTNAEAAETKLAQAETEAKRINDRAYTEARKLNATAKAQAKEEVDGIITKANGQARRIVAAAEKEAVTIKQKAMAEAREHIGGIIILALEKIVGNELDDSQREKLTAGTIKDLYQ